MRDVVSEFDDLVLPDERLVRRVREFVGLAWKAPAESFPRMLEDAAQLEGGYRMLNNPRVTFEALQAPHAARSAARAMTAGEVVVVHDTTEVDTPYLDESEASYLRTGRLGYRAHISLAVAVQANGPSRPFGVLCAQAEFQSRPPKSGKKQSRNGWATARSKDKAFMRWFRGIDASAEALGTASCVIHVADREADSYPLFHRVMELGHGCVIRLRTDRRARLVDDDNFDDEWSYLSDVASAMQGSFQRTVPLSKRGNKAAPVQLKRHPPREARGALLQYSAVPVELKKPHYQPASLPASLELTLVRVWEPEPPDGEQPVEWLLLTTESCATPEEIVRVVDLYRARWVIEDFFKALKTGCALETRQLESRHALLNTLALFLPVAVHLLWLRTCARDAPGSPATEAFTSLQLKVLAHVSHRKMPSNPTVLDALWALAGYGGHIANNGWPGWQVLGRAFARLIDAVATWRQATNAARAEM